jgi:hypothetical protein
MVLVTLYYGFGLVLSKPKEKKDAHRIIKSHRIISSNQETLQCQPPLPAACHLWR